MKFCGGQKDDEQDSDDEWGIYMVIGGKNTKKNNTIRLSLS